MESYNKATKAVAAAKLDHWEAAHYMDGAKNRARKTAKRDARRASRRLSKAIIAEEG